MTLAHFARLLGVSPKWVLNTMRALDLPPQYTPALARRLSIARAVHDGVGMPLPAAFAMARDALAAWDGERLPVTMMGTSTDDVALTVDVYRLLSAMNVRLADLRESFAPKVRGRPPRARRDPLEAAMAWGLDLSLLRDNLRKSPHARLRQLDAMRAFASAVRRTAAPTRVPDV